MAAVQIGSGVGYVEPAEAQRPVETPTPAVPIEDSVTPDYILSLEDGKPYRSLRRHLMARYGLTPDEYRRKWGLPSDYPMAAPNYAQERSEVAKRIGLGRGAKAKRPVGKSAKSGATPRVRRGA
jgi:predicted transcriptional regulator